MRRSCVIIGGGIGGLFTGAILAKNGMKVTVLEKNAVVGGGLQCFNRNGKIFDTGMHILGGFMPGGNVERICRYLGIADKLRIKEFNPDGMAEVRFAAEGRSFLVPAGKDKFIERISGYFPSETEGIKDYVRAIYRITEEMPLFLLKAGDDRLMDHSEEFLMPVDKFIARYVSDPVLRSLLAYLSPLYDGDQGHTPAYVHALLNVLFMDGTASFIGGSQQLADVLKDLITSCGGEVLPKSEVTKIDVKDSEVKGVKTIDGRNFQADYYIGAIYPSVLAGMVPKGSLGKSYERRLKEIPVTLSAFSVFIDLKPETFKFIDRPLYLYTEPENVWRNKEVNDKDWPSSILVISPPDEARQEYANRLIAICLMKFDEVREWEDTGFGHRTDSYKRWKKSCEERILNKLERWCPEISGNIKAVYSSSPLTIRDFYNAPEGALYGYRKDSQNIFLSQLFVHTKLKNLYLTGQNIYLHGIGGVPLTAISTAEAILGQDAILKQIPK